MFWLMTFVPGTAQRAVYKDMVAWTKKVNRMLRMRGLPAGFGRVPRNPDAMAEVIKCVDALITALGALDRGATAEQGWAVLYEHLPV